MNELANVTMMLSPTLLKIIMQSSLHLLTRMVENNGFPKPTRLIRLKYQLKIKITSTIFRRTDIYDF